MGAAMTRKNSWKARIIGGLIAAGWVAGSTGCKQPIFLEPADWQAAVRPNIPANLETDPSAPITPPNVVPGMNPATVLDPKRPLRPISMKEAVAIAIEQGNTGFSFQGFDNIGRVNDSALTFQGRSVSGTDTIKALLLDPAIAATETERALSKFDARWTSSLSWGKQDQATLNLQQSFSNGDTFQLSSTLAKPLPAGGLAAITTSLNYLNLSNPPPSNSGFVTLNSSYTPRVQFIFEQPLARGFGVETNQLSSGLANSVLVPGLLPSGGTNSEGILITRIRNEQSRQQFDAQVNQLLLNVEAAYWNLYSAYYNLYAQEEGLKQSLAGVLFFQNRAAAGVDPPYQVPQSVSQYWSFRQQVITARGQVLSADRNLRGILGMKSDDGTIFRPVDEPTEAKHKPDFYANYAEALQNRPELMLARQEVKASQLLLLFQKNQRMPDARLFGSYDVTALGATLGGDRDTNALAGLADNRFNSWQFGLRFDMPIGFREANAVVRATQLALWRAYVQLQDGERKAYEVLVDAFRRMDEAYAIIEAARAGRLATQDLVKKFDDRVRGGVFNQQEYINLLQAQRDLARATSDEYRAISNYNTALAMLEFAKGSIQPYNNVSVSDGPLPAYVHKKAADHFRAQSVALKIREHPAALPGRFQPMDMDALPDLRPAGSMQMPMLLQTPGGPAGQPMPMPMPLPPTPPAAGGTVAGVANPVAPGTWSSWQTNSQPGGVSPTTIPVSGGATFTPSGTLKLEPRGSRITPLPLPSSGPIPILSSPNTPISAIPPR